MSTTLPAILLSACAGLAIGAGVAAVALSPAGPPPTSRALPPRREFVPGPGQLERRQKGGVVRAGNIGPIADYSQRIAYSAGYDRRNRIPAWTAQHLTAESLRKIPTEGGSGDGNGNGGGDRSNSTFREDDKIPAMFRGKLLDYFKSGYDRGHMVPAADAKQSQQAMDETFILSNVAPQVGEGFNRHYWAYLEAFCRNLTKEFEDVYVFTVPLFLPKKFTDGKWRVSYEMIGPQNGPPSVAVPTHFAKVILTSRSSSAAGRGFSKALTTIGAGDGKEWSLGAFVLPNDVIPDQVSLETFLVPVETVESSAGLTLLPDELKSIARPLCATTSCQLVVRRFLDSGKGNGNGKGKGRNGGRDRSVSI